MSETVRDPLAEPPKKARRPSPVMPRVAERTTGGKIASFLIHAIAILLLFLPAFNHKMLQVDMEGAGGAGPAGGGGGGHRGSGGAREEHLTYVTTAPQPALVVPKVIPPIVEKKPDPVVTPPPPVVTPPEATKADSTSKVVAEATAPVIGTGGGTGNDGTNGTGPGTGGGKGSGNGTGTGTKDGPGTGGGNGTKYKASVTTLVLPPLPAPAKVKPYSMTACFEVDSVGHQRLLDWNKSRDDGYNRKVLETLNNTRFKPAWDPKLGMAVRDTTCINVRVG